MGNPHAREQACHPCCWQEGHRLGELARYKGWQWEVKVFGYSALGGHFSSEEK